VNPAFAAAPRLILLWMVFMVPLVVLKIGNDYVFQPKTAVAMGGVLLAWAALAQGSRWRSIFREPILPPLSAFAAASFISAVGAVNLPQSFRLALEQAGWAGLALAVVIVAPSRIAVSAACALTVAVQLAVALLQLSGNYVVGHGEIFGAGRIYATMGNPSFFGVYLAPTAVFMAVSLAVDLARRRFGRAGWQGAALVAALFLLYRAAVIDAWAGLAVGGALGVWLQFRRGGRVPGGRGGGRLAVTAGAVIFLLGAWMAVMILLPRLHDRMDYLKVKAFSWHAGAWLWRENPLIGAGPGGFQTEAPRVMARVHALWTGPWGVPATFIWPHDEAYAHQDFLQLLAETGVAGCGLWVWALMVAWRASRSALKEPGEERSCRAACWGGLAAFIPTMGMHFPLHLAPPLVMFWLFLGLTGKSSQVPGVEGNPPVLGFRIAIAAFAVAAFVPVARGWTANAYLGQGYRTFLGGAPEAAVPYFDRFESLDPANFEGRFYSGALHQAQGNDARALEEYDRALELYPGMQGAIYNLGNLRFRRKDYAGAAGEFSRVLAINPVMVEALNNRGNSWAALGRMKEAEMDYLRAVALRPGYADALYNMAVTRYRLGDQAGARKWFRAVLEADPGYPQAGSLADSLGIKMPRKAR